MVTAFCRYTILFVGPKLTGKCSSYMVSKPDMYVTTSFPVLQLLRLAQTTQATRRVVGGSSPMCESADQLEESWAAVHQYVKTHSPEPSPEYECWRLCTSLGLPLRVAFFDQQIGSHVVCPSPISLSSLLFVLHIVLFFILLIVLVAVSCC